MNSFFVCFVMFLMSAVCYGQNSDVVVMADENDEGPEIIPSHLSAEERKAYKVFQPTNEWQTIPEGMAIPEGAHIRMNMDTGKNEVKLMKEVPVTGDKHGPHIAVMSDGESDTMMNSRQKIFTQEELSEALGNIKADDVVTDEDRERVATEYRSIDELKADYEKISASMKTDVQILSGLISELKTSGKAIEKDRLKIILEDIEYLSHQIDNGMEIAKMGGISLLITYANGSDVDIIQASLLCLGSTMQSNHFVQESALASGILPVVFKTLLKRVDGNPSHVVLRSRALYALSTLLRNFPLAQQQFLATGGINSLKRLFTDAVSEVPLNERFAVKIIGLIGDLVKESDSAMSIIKSAKKVTDAESALLQEYAALNLREQVVDADWCNSAASLLTSSLHDTREKALRLITLLAKDCKKVFNLTALSSRLEQLLSEYNELLEIEKAEAAKSPADPDINSADTGEDDYFQRMAETVTSALALLGDNSQSNSKNMHNEL